MADPASCVDVITPAGTGYNFTASLGVGSSPFGVAVDNATNDVFVTDTGSDNVTVLSASTLTSIASIAVGGLPHGVAYDWASNDIYVANTGSQNVSVISGATLKVVATVPVGTSPVGVAADPTDRHVFVANYGSSNVSVILDSSNAAVASVPTGNGSYGVAWDNASDEVFVTNEGSNNVSVMDGASDAVVAAIPVPGTYGITLQGLTYDAATQQVWVGGGWSFAVVLNATSHTVVGYAGTDPSGAAYDPTSHAVCLTNTANDTFECLTARSPVVTSATYVTLHEQGLPTGTPWTAGLNQSGTNVTWSTSTTDNVTFGADRDFSFGPFKYAIVAPSGYFTNSTVGQTYLALHLDVVNIVFRPTAGAYPVGFTETGLPGGTTWSLSAGGVPYQTDTATVVAWLTNGTQNFTVSPAGAFDPSPSSGSVTVNGSAQNVSIAFTNPNLFSITFGETGLANGTEWEVYASGYTTGGSGIFEYTAGSGPTLRLNLSNGSYAFTPLAVGYTTTAGSTPFTVNGSAVALSVPFTYVGTTVYNVTFVESGLVPGTFWSGSLDGMNGSSTDDTITFHVLNGTYDFVVTSTGYAAVPGWGNLTVQGSNATVPVAFTLAPYGVEFVESGLPPMQSWFVDLNGQRQPGISSAIAFSEPNGTFAYSVSPAGGLYPVPANGTVTVAGGDVVIQIAYGPLEYPVTFTESGLPNGTPWSLFFSGSERTTDLSTMVVEEPNGSYSVSIAPEPGYSSPAPRTVVVAGAAVPVSVPFAIDVFAVTFHESGLPKGTGWGVLIGSDVASGLASNLTFEEPNGTYGYVVLAVSGYVGSSSGVVFVTGAPTYVNVTFRPQTFPIVFVEFGLPTGANWSVTVANSSTGFHLTQNSTSNAITFFLPNGTYAVTFTLPPGFSANATSTQITVAGRAATGATVTIGPTGTRTSATGTGLGWDDVAAAAGIGLLVGVALLWVAGRRSMPPRPPAAKSS
ncbi:MAG: YncE family protein [Thermoplasmata archaeon]|nr:YncE family protein [Thermoplasmata archaeon]